MATATKFDWRGSQVKAKLLKAAEGAVNFVMAAAVIEGKLNHGGWKNVTGTAEGSVRIQQFARLEGSHMVGRWGSMNVDYVIWLEIKNGSFLRSAAGVKYPLLTGEIRKRFQ